MKSIAGIIRKVNGETFRTVSIKDAEELQKHGVKLYTIDNLKSIFIKIN